MWGWVGGWWWWWWVPGKRSGGEPAQGLLPPFPPSHSSVLKKHPRSLTGPLPPSSAALSPAPSCPEKLALGSSPMSALFPHRTRSTKHLEWGRHSGNIKSLLDIYVVFYPSFIQMLPTHHSRQRDVTIKHADSGVDHLDSNWVPPLRLCMTLDKLSRLPKLRGRILEMRETVPAPGVMTRIKPIILYHVGKT